MGATVKGTIREMQRLAKSRGGLCRSKKISTPRPSYGGNVPGAIAGKLPLSASKTVKAGALCVPTIYLLALKK